MIEVTQAPWHYTTFWDWLDHWQTGIAGALAFVAGVGTVVATMIIARRQMNASREEADKVIAATHAQTETTVRLEQTRNANEVSAFRVMLEAAMERVLAEAAWARQTYPQLMTQKSGASTEALTVRQCITKGAFAELRAVCVRQGGPLNREFLELEREIDSFALQWEDRQMRLDDVVIRMGLHAGLGDQLALIERNAEALREKAALDRFGLILPGRGEHAAPLD